MAYTLAGSRVYRENKHLIPAGKRIEFLRELTLAVKQNIVSTANHPDARYRRTMAKAVTASTLDTMMMWGVTPQGHNYWQKRHAYFRQPTKYASPWTGQMGVAPKKRKKLRVVCIPII